MMHWNVLKWRKLFMATNCSAVNHFFDCYPAWCACWPCYLLFAKYHGGTPFKEFVIFRLPWRVTQSPRFFKLQLGRSSPFSRAWHPAIWGCAGNGAWFNTCCSCHGSCEIHATREGHFPLRKCLALLARFAFPFFPQQQRLTSFDFCEKRRNFVQKNFHLQINDLLRWGAYYWSFKKPKTIRREWLMRNFR